MRKQGGPPKNRNQALARLLNIPSSGRSRGRRTVWRRDRRGPVVSKATGLSFHARGTRESHERQQDRLLVDVPAAAQPIALFAVQPSELEVGPELTEAAVARVAE